VHADKQAAICAQWREGLAHLRLQILKTAAVRLISEGEKRRSARLNADFAICRQRQRRVTVNGKTTLAAIAAFGPRRRVPRTGAGTATRIQALGFKQYLATAEAEQIRFEEAENIFSRYLPYAMVFGVADHWVKIFRELAIERNVEWSIDWIDVGADVAGELVFQMLTLDLLDGADGLFDGISGLFDGFDLGDFLDGIDFDFDF